jgi:hypothetical protein
VSIRASGMAAKAFSSADCSAVMGLEPAFLIGFSMCNINGPSSWLSRRLHFVIARSACDEAIQGTSTVRAALDRHAAKWRLAMTGNYLAR